MNVLPLRNLAGYCIGDQDADIMHLRFPAFAGRRKDRRIRRLERTVGRKSLEIEILKNVVGCGEVLTSHRTGAGNWTFGTSREDSEAEK